MTEQADPAAAPLDADSGFRMLPPEALRAWRVTGMLGAAVPLLVLAGPLFLLTVLRGEMGMGVYVALLAVLFALLAGIGWWHAGLRWRHTGWRLDADGLRIRRGAWWRSETLVPRSRVQHVDLNHGPLDRRFGLAGLKVHTAGTRLSSVQLGGLRRADAESLRDALVEDALDSGSAPSVAAAAATPQSPLDDDGVAP